MLDSKLHFPLFIRVHADYSLVSANESDGHKFRAAKSCIVEHVSVATPWLSHQDHQSAPRYCQREYLKLSLI